MFLQPNRNGVGCSQNVRKLLRATAVGHQLAAGRPQRAFQRVAGSRHPVHPLRGRIPFHDFCLHPEEPWGTQPCGRARRLWRHQKCWITRSNRLRLPQHDAVNLVGTRFASVPTNAPSRLQRSRLGAFWAYAPQKKPTVSEPKRGTCRRRSRCPLPRWKMTLWVAQMG